MGSRDSSRRLRKRVAEGRGSGADIARIKLSYSILPPTGSALSLVPLAGRSRASSAPHVIVLCPLLPPPPPSTISPALLFASFPLFFPPLPHPTSASDVSYASFSQFRWPRFLQIGFSNLRSRPGFRLYTVYKREQVSGRMLKVV